MPVWCAWKSIKKKVGKFQQFFFSNIFHRFRTRVRKSKTRKSKIGKRAHEKKKKNARSKSRTRVKKKRAFFFFFFKRAFEKVVFSNARLKNWTRVRKNHFFDARSKNLPRKHEASTFSNARFFFFFVFQTRVFFLVFFERAFFFVFQTRVSFSFFPNARFFFRFFRTRVFFFRFSNAHSKTPKKRERAFETYDFFSKYFFLGHTIDFAGQNKLFFFGILFYFARARSKFEGGPGRVPKKTITKPLSNFE